MKRYKFLVSITAGNHEGWEYLEDLPESQQYDALVGDITDALVDSGLEHCYISRHIDDKPLDDLRPLIQRYVEVIEYSNKVNDKLNTYLHEIDSDNHLHLGMTYDLESMYSRWVIRVIGQDKFDWIGWWIYDTVNFDGERHASVSDDSGIIELETFDEFYDFVFNEVSAAEIMDKRNGGTNEKVRSN